jgi:Zn-finger nucleic acid-binding protein
MTESVQPKRPPAGSLHCPNCGAAVALDAKECIYCQAPLATMSCPTCFNRVFIGAAYCPHCGTKTMRQDGAEAAPEACPRCHTPMAAVRVGAMSLAECPGCFGVWVDVEAFERLCADREAQAAVVMGDALHRSESGTGPAASAPIEKISYRPCPRCRKMMNRVNFARYSGVVLDVCRTHGTFFDRDELHRVVSFIQGGGLDRARARDREALLEEERRLRALQLREGAQSQAAFQGDAPAAIYGSRAAFDLFIDLLFHSK